MKAILVIDMPKSCADCKLADFGRCWGTYSYVHMRSDDIPVNCPLKPMPSKKVPIFDQNSASYDEEYEKRIMYEIDGYNRCIDEIKGETE